MAKMTIKGLDKYMTKMENLAQSKAEEFIGEEVRSGADIVADQVRSNLNGVLSGTSSGDLAGSLGITPVDNRDGYINVKVGFDGVDSNGVPNVLKANILEYGTHDDRQPARPFMKPAATATRSTVKAKITKGVERKFEYYMKG